MDDISKYEIAPLIELEDFQCPEGAKSFFIRGFDNGKGTDSGRAIASSQGSANLSHGHSVGASVTDPGHKHTTTVDNAPLFPANGGVSINYGGAGGYPATNFSMNTNTTGISVSISQSDSGGSEARPRNIAMMYIIKI